MTDPAVALASQVRTIERSTGRTVDQWAGVVAAAGLEKHGQIVAFLKTEHLIRDFRRHTGVTPSEYVAAQRCSFTPDQAAPGFVPKR